MSLALSSTLIISGCSLITGAVALGSLVVVGTASLVGYTVYKGGEAVYDGGKAVTSSLLPDDKDEENDALIIYSHGIMKTKEKENISDVYTSFTEAISEAGFKITTNKHDKLSGVIKAETVTKDVITVRLELISKKLTSIEIKVGSGNLKQSEYIYNEAVKKLYTNKKENSK